MGVWNDSETQGTVLHQSDAFHCQFFHSHIMYKRNWDGSCLINLIYLSLCIFQISN